MKPFHRPQNADLHPGAEASRLSPLRKTIAWVTLCAFTLQPIIAAAQVVADLGAGANRPQVGATASGLPIVQIVAPSAAGVSHNKYQQFNVDPQGLILNNSPVIAPTQQAGYVEGNPNLSGGPARIILNEVTSTNPSTLRGYTEVAGSKAEVIIANPNGITCNGCGFINTTRGVLTTGTPVFGGSGSLDAFRVTGGSIAIEGAGLNGTNTDQLDLIARSVQINGGLWAKNLNVVTGANHVNYSDLGVQIIQGDANKPTVGIDVALLGGMYANKIRLVGTEAGVGVVSAGTLAAQAGELTIDNQGNVTLNGNTSATGDVAITTGGNFANSGTFYGQQHVQITAQGQAGNTGTLAAQGSLALTAGSVNATGSLGAGIQLGGEAGASGNLTVTATNGLTSTGHNLAGGNVILSGASLNLTGAQTSANGNVTLTATSGDIDHSGASLQAQGIVAMNAQGALNNDAGTIFGNRLTISAASLSNQGGALSQSGTGDTRITLTGGLNNTNGSISSNGQNLNIQSGQLTNTQGSLAHAGTGQLTVQTGILQNGSGSIGTNGTLQINATRIDNRSGAVSVLKQAVVETSIGIDNSSNGYIGADSLTVTAQGAVNNAGGTLEANNGVTLGAQSLGNAGGILRNTGAHVVAVTTTQSIDNTQGGFIGGNGQVSVTAGSLDNTGGMLYAKNNLTVQSATTIGNQSGLIQTDAALNITAQGALANAAGQIEANGATSATTVTASTIDNNSGRIASSGTGKLTVNGGASITNRNAANASGMGLIGGNGDVEINATQLANTQGGKLLAGGNLVLNTPASIDNTHSTLYATGDLTVNQPGANINNTQGSIGATGSVSLHIASLNNQSGSIAADTNVYLTAAELTGIGSIVAGGNATIGLQGNYTNQSGNEFKANGNLTFSTTGNFTNQTTLEAVGDLALNAANIDNQSGAIINSANTTLNAGSNLTNAGHIEGNTVTATAASLTNTGTFIGDTLTLNAGNLSNQGAPAIIAATGTVNLFVGNALTNQGGATIYSLGDIHIAADNTLAHPTAQIVNESSVIEAQGDIGINVGTLTNRRASFTIAKVQTASTPLTEYQVWDSGWSASVINNPAYNPLIINPPDQIGYERRRTEQSVTREDQLVSAADPGQILAGRNLNIAAAQVDNQESRIIAHDSLNVQATGSLTNRATQLQQATETTVVHKVCYDIQGAYPGSAGSCSSGWINVPTVSQSTTVIGSLTAQMQSDNTLSIEAGNITNTAVSASGNIVSGIAQTVGTNQPSNAVTGAAPQSVGTVTQGQPSLSLPASGLYTTHPDPGQHYLVETDPRFTSYRNFISSDYLLARLGIDPANTQKRLGDGFYEQKLVTDQLTLLTGRRYLDGFNSGVAQFQALLESGTQVAQSFNLKVGIALTAEQMVQLTQDMAWLVEETVAGQKVLTPVVYLAQGISLKPSGALIAAKNLTLNATDIANRGGTIQAADSALVQAANDILNQSGRIQGNTVTMVAGRDITNTTQTSTLTRHTDQGEAAFGLVSQPGEIVAQGNLILSAGRNLSLTGSQTRAGGNALLAAQGDLTVGTVTTTSQTSLANGGSRYESGSTTQVGSRIDTGGDLTLIANGNATLTGAQIAAGNNLTAVAQTVILDEARDSQTIHYAGSGPNTSARGDLHDETVSGSRLTAGRDILIQANNGTATLTGSSLQAAGAATLKATGNVTLNTATETHQRDEEYQTQSRHFLSSKSTDSRDISDSTLAVGSLVSADAVTIHSGHDLNIQGSNVVSTQGTLLTAQNNINIEAATNTTTESHFRDEKTSGLFSSGGISITYGTRQQSADAKNTLTTAVASTVGSTQGNVTIQAGEAYWQVGSNVVAPQGNIDINAKKIDIIEAQNASQSSAETRFKQSGLTVALTSPVISAIQTASQMKQAASQTSDPRMQALAAATTALAAKNGYDAVASNPSQAGGINVSISIGSSQSQSNSAQTASQAAGSTVTAGGNVNLSATGAGKDSDITIQGSTVKAGNNITLSADNDINLLAAKSTADQHSTNKSSSASVGVSFGTDGLLLNVSAFKGRGNADGSDVNWSNGRIEAGNQLTLESGADTTLKGAVASGKQVTANIGGNLNIESLQDTSQYDSKQQSLGGSVSVGYGKVGGSINVARSNINSNFASVIEQSGIKAGDEGFQVNVKGNTDLKGAVIASTDQAVQDNKNTLTTATLTTSDIENRAEASAKSSGINLSSDMLSQGKYGVSKALVGTALNNGQASGSSAGVTRSAVQAANVTISDDAAQQALTGKTAEQTVASLNRDTANAHSAAQKQDVQAMERTAQAEQAIKQEAFKMVATFTDEAYRSRFKEQPKPIKVECPAGANCVTDPSKLTRSLATAEDIKNAVPGSILAVNGILNDEKRAAELGYQNIVLDEVTGNKPAIFYVMHIAPANNTISELLGVAYEKIVTSADYGLANFLGYTNAMETYAALLASRDQQETQSLGHSRGTLTQEASFTILANRSDENGNTYTNPNLTVRGVGGAADAESYSAKAAAIQGPKGDRDNITYNYFSNDPVATSKLSGSNPGVWTLKDLWQVFDTTNSMHSCYGTGAADCTQIEIPVPGGPQGTPEGNAKLIEYVGGQRKGNNQVNQQTGGQQ